MTHVVPQNLLGNPAGDWIRSQVFGRRATSGVIETASTAAAALDLTQAASLLHHLGRVPVVQAGTNVTIAHNALGPVISASGGGGGSVDWGEGLAMLPRAQREEMLQAGSGITLTRNALGPVIAASGGGGGGGEWTFVERVTLGVAGTTIASTVAWDLATHARYKVVFYLKNNSAVDSFYNLNYNGDAVATNYYRRLESAAGAFNGNDALFGNMEPSACTTGEFIVRRDLDGYPNAGALMHCRAPNTFEINRWYHARNNTANVTSMQLTWASGFAAGSYIDIYRKT